MEFRVKSKCKYCGQEFVTFKRYNDFIGTWEIDRESCEECCRVPVPKIDVIDPMSQFL
jgi:hypothetical protein